jgi:hypothetical protein
MLVTFFFAKSVKVLAFSNLYMYLYVIKQQQN